MRASRQLILAAATGYTWPQLAPFVASLRRSGCQAEVVILVASLSTDGRAQLAAAGVRAWQIQPVLSRLPTWWRRKFFSRRLGFLHRGFVRVSDTLPFSIERRRLVKAWLGRTFHHVACSRYFFYLSFLSRHARDYDRVLLTDVRDVIFQGDPFAQPAAAPLEFFLEHRTARISADYGNSAWVRNTCGEAAFAQIADRRISCSGVTYGTTDGMLAYLARMTDLLTAATDRIAGFDGHDQGAHNWLVWSQALPEAVLHENNHGPVLTMHGAQLEEFHVNDRDQFVGDDGAVIPVLHQYDRHPDVAKRLLRQLNLAPS
jgi:hypothetical protein